VACKSSLVRIRDNFSSISQVPVGLLSAGNAASVFFSEYQANPGRIAGNLG
jgi:hypothetical protein